jgi:S1-C subfamily serine protease
MWLIALVLSMVLASGTATAFDCAGVKFPPTLVICSDPELMQLADERQAAINEARARIGEQAWPALWEDQRKWVRSYATACGVPPNRPPPSPVPASIKECFKRAGEARVAYLRFYGVAASSGSPSPPPEAAANGRVGPSYDCGKAATPLTLLICADSDLSRLDLRFGQAYWALFQQLGPSERPFLKEEDLTFIDQVQDQCGLPKAGVITAEVRQARDCVRAGYEKMRQAWVSRLTGAAREEADRSVNQHVELQSDLQRLGFIPPGPVDGVYGPDTRAGIVAWQTARGRAVTGFLGDSDAAAVKAEVSTSSQSVARQSQQPQVGSISGEGGTTSQPSPPQVAAREEQRPRILEPDPAATGTAFAINTSGDFLTNYHVVKDCSTLRLRIPGIQQGGTPTFTDERNDLAVVHSSATGIAPLRLREGKGIRPADGVVVLGFPYAGLLATSPQVTTGAVSALAGINDDSRYLQLTAPVQPGNSGGPLLDLSGNVVGIVSARINELAVAQLTGSLPQNINFAIKSSIIRDFLDAHQVDYSLAQSDKKLDPADVGGQAMKSTVLIACYK